jgi:uncharacterized SAM-binding protein YcdF (DUF218 family)/lysophospholipase L1-like esterase
MEAPLYSMGRLRMRRPSAADSPSATSATRRRWRRPFVCGVVAGIALVLGGHWVIDNTRFPDHLVAPLLRADTPGNGDVIVVLGAAVNERCSPNLYAIRRAMFARDAFRAGRAPRILITGGRAAGTPCSVAGAMRNLLVELGVPGDRVLLETAARSTWDNARFSDSILRPLNARRIVLVTDVLHMRRAEACFRALGYQVERLSVPVSESHPDNVSMLAMGLRETIAYCYYQLEGRLDRAGVVEASASPAPVIKPTTAAQASSSPMSSNAASPQRPFPDGPVVILGASYSRGWSPSVAGRRVVNKGIEGQQSWELAERFERDVVAERPRAVLIWGFINDIFRSARPRMPETLERIRTSMTSMVAAARAQGVEPILATEVTVTHPNTWRDSAMATIGWLLGRESYQDYINAQVTAVNTWLRDYARREGLMLLDLHGAMSDASGRRQRPFAAEDGSHISPAGYAALSRYAEPLLAAQLAKP